MILAAGSGMRQGECLGLTVDRLDFLRRVVHVDRQLVTVTGRPSFLTAPKTAASVRTIEGASPGSIATASVLPCCQMR